MPPIADCPNITHTATAHASLLTTAGVDYVVVDISNWPRVDVDNTTDIAVLRPTQVLFEEWSALRAAGIATPAIAVWPCSPANSNTWQWLLDNLYNNATFESLVYMQEGKKVVFLPYHSKCNDAAMEARILSNGGRNDIKIIHMWAQFNASEYANGTWGFFSPCVDAATGAYTTSMVTEDDCSQPITTDATTGAPVAMAASGSYMLAPTSLALGSPGHMRGLTMQRLFKRVLEVGPPNLFISSFNEHIGGRVPPPYKTNIAFNQGLPHDTQRSSVWVDTYGSEFSRDIEPTVEGGDLVFNITASCIALYKANVTCDTAPAGTLCCDFNESRVFSNIWSLTRVDGSDALLTNSLTERNALVASGVWTEACHAIHGPTIMCVNISLLDGRNGPFIMYNTSAARPTANETQAVYRCETAKGTHFPSLDAACEGNGTMRQVLGYSATSRGGETVRQLWRCVTPAGAYTHALDLACDVPAPDPATGSNSLGYVK